MTNNDLLALPGAIRSFNGFYSISGKFILINSIRILIVSTFLVGAVLIAFIIILVRYIRRRNAARTARQDRLAVAANSCIKG